ncbi:MAG TPA: cysteine desulfurase NifS, partial [Nitrospiraceae bacterium]|nr:cysteine desulfurase NifS [Nitrospiraceae bacterium]
MIYLDNNATTPIDTEVREDMFQCLRENFGNPSSGHNIGKKAKEAIEKARLQVAGLIGARPEEIIFTSGGTEANNMAILGTAIKFKAGHIITSSIEHPSVMQPCKYLAGLGFEITYLRVDRFGLIDVAGLRSAIREDTILITIMHSNNEIGTIQPIKELGEIARDR